jgi:4-amino-4-deoxy-L-arabinose transferase-like glycosyltransferase
MSDAPASRMPWAWILPALALKLAIQFSVAGRYGWHRDELYYVEAGQHPAAGYVDFPPVTAFLARLSHALFGDSLVALRSFAFAAGAGVIVVACLICRRLGGGPTAMAITAFVLALAPFLLAINAMFQTVSFDQLAWALVILATLVVVERPTTRNWVLLGAAVGLALMTKYTSLVLIAGLLGGYAMASPATLRDRRLGLAALVATVMVVPNLIWQIGHDWSSVDFILHPPPSASDESRPEFVGNLLLLTGPAILILALTGAVRLWRSPRRRPLALAAAFVVAIFFVTGGKSYYAVPAVVALVPAGAITAERLAGRWRRWIPAALTATAVVYLLGGLPQVLPVRGEREMASSGLWDDRSDYADEVGWPELVRQSARAYRAAGRPSAVVTRNYGEAGAINLYGPDLGLPRALSRHVTHRYWGPGRFASSTTALLVGFDPPDLERLCGSHRLLGRITNHLGIHNPEWGSGLVDCRLRAPLGELWSRVPSA